MLTLHGYWQQPTQPNMLKPTLHRAQFAMRKYQPYLQKSRRQPSRSTSSQLKHNNRARPIEHTYS